MKTITMKLLKVCLLFPAVALIAAGCAGEQARIAQGSQTTNASSVIATPIALSPSISSEAAAMPTMTYKVTQQTLNRFGNPIEARIDLFADGSKIASVDNTSIFPMGDVVFFAGNSQEVFFTIQQSGTGDNASLNTNAYEVRIQSGMVKTLVSGNYATDDYNYGQDFDITPQLTYLSYVIKSQTEPPSFTIRRLDLGTGMEDDISFNPFSTTTPYFVSNLRTSPNGREMAIAVEVPVPGQYAGMGPWQIWIVNIATHQATFYKAGGTVSSHWIEITGWADDSTPLWQYLGQ